MSNACIMKRGVTCESLLAADHLILYLLIGAKR